MDDISGKKLVLFSSGMVLDDETPSRVDASTIFAGSLIKEAADSGIPMMGVTLLNRPYNRKIEGGKVESWYDDSFNPKNYGLESLDDMVASVQIQGRSVQIKPWLKNVKGDNGTVPVLFLDAHVDGNHPWDAQMTDAHLDGDAYWQLGASAILGKAGSNFLNQLKVQPETFHYNEPQAAIISLMLRHALGDAEAARNKTILTTQGLSCMRGTATEKFLDVVRDIPAHLLGDARNNGTVDLMKLALSGTNYGYVPDARILELIDHSHPGSGLKIVPMGVHPSLMTPEFREIYETSDASNADAGAIAAAHLIAKGRLVDLINSRLSQEATAWNKDVLTITFGGNLSRATEPGLLMSNSYRLKQVAGGRAQILYLVPGVIDEETERTARALLTSYHCRSGGIELFVLPDNDFKTVRTAASGSDVWVDSFGSSKTTDNIGPGLAALHGVPSIKYQHPITASPALSYGAFFNFAPLMPKDSDGLADIWTRVFSLYSTIAGINSMVGRPKEWAEVSRAAMISAARNSPSETIRMLSDLYPATPSRGPRVLEKV